MDILLKYFPNLSPEQIKQFKQLGPLYAEWNEKINVISRKDIDQLYEHHVLHSLGIGKIIEFVPGTNILDVGTGGGFPGIPLAILFPECNFTLIDSIGKKIKVVEGVAEAIGLKNLKAMNVRAETVPGKFDFVVSRAVTRFLPFYTWIKAKLSTINKNTLPNGILYLKGGDLDEEIAELKERFPHLHKIIHPLKDHFAEEFYETKAVVQLW